MAEIDAELVERVRRWCAEAGRDAGRDEIVSALAPLSWDELLAARALLADPPPVRPLGPLALADLARGAPPDVAAEREREGRYRREDGGAAPSAAGEPPASSEPARRRGRASRRPQIVVRRARDRIAAPPPAAPALPPLDALRAPAGRAVLERLVRAHGGRRGALVSALAAGWRREGAGAPGEADLDALLEHHGLARAYAHRERDEVLHALRAAGGVRARAAARLGLDLSGLDAALARLGAAPGAEAIREERRAELRSRATLAERAGLLLREEERLADLGLLPEVEADLRARLPEHVRALEAGAEPLVPALSRTLSIGLPEAGALAARFGLAFTRRRAPAEARPDARRPDARGPGKRTAAAPRRRPGAPPRGGGTAPRGPARGAPAPRPSGPGPRPLRAGPRRGGGGARRGPPRRGR